jgi:dipeptidyl aminopeptidase/acylaminoacyl peptidase
MGPADTSAGPTLTLGADLGRVFVKGFLHPVVSPVARSGSRFAFDNSLPGLNWERGVTVFRVAVLALAVFSSIHILQASETCAAGSAQDSTRTGVLIFHSDWGGNDDIYSMNADGTGLQRLTDDPGVDVLPNVSQDGSMTAFDSDRDGNFEVYIMSSDGNGQTRLTHEVGEDGFSCWSPDGSRIAFYSDRDGDPEIFVMDADGSDQEQLTFNSAPDYDPAWAPDGESIAFMTRRHGYGEIYIMNPDGTGEQRLTSRPSYDDVHPNWSPDGTQIAFASGLSAAGYEIYVMDADGSNVNRLTDSSGDNYFPAWSPDGSEIVFVSDRYGNFEILIMKPDGTEIERINDNTSNEWRVDWCGSQAGSPHMPDREDLSRLGTIQVYPNPVRRDVTVTLAVRHTAAVRVDICDVRGRLLRSLLCERDRLGLQTATWDLLDHSGCPLGPAVYLCGPADASRTESGKLVILK